MIVCYEVVVNDDGEVENSIRNHGFRLKNLIVCTVDIS